MSRKYGVTVICLAYNHEKYIEQTLKGFVAQKVNFPYRIIVHDDASTDGTADIIRNYERAYPGLIVGIYQHENMYSQKRAILAEFILPHIDSEYVALCEGDDYWIDEHKLQRQFNAMEQNKSCMMCTHRVREVRENGEPNGILYPPYEMETGVISGDHFMELAQRYSFHTSSYFFRADEYIKYAKAPPNFRKVSGVGDVCDLLYFGYLGDVYYINEVMSCYRRGVSVSWSAAAGNPRNTQKHIDHLGQMILVMQEFDKFSNYKYHSFMEKRIALYAYRKIILEENTRAFLRAGGIEKLRTLPFKNKLLVCAAAVFPKITKKIYLNRNDNIRNKRF